MPRGIGHDIAGIVDAIGEGVDPGAARIDGLVFGAAEFHGQPSAGTADVAILNHSPYSIPPYS
ncbi:hypothetical protein [Mycobacterium sp. 050134]|uniref:hypothetical protein n=1 Tax=Mycobacterium sp. 050134 TaxID=3096111 RepID=UPI002EDA9351